MLYLRVWDVTHGSAIYIKTPNGRHIVLDLGVGSFSERDDTFSPLLYIKDKMKVDKLDEVIVTHPHADHIADICNFDILDPQILCRPEHLTEKEIISSNRSKDKILVDAYIEINKRCVETIDVGDSPLKTENNGGAHVQIFLSKECARSNINNHSLVTIISYATTKILLPGDNGAESWENLLQQEDFNRAIEGTDIFFASHHGIDSGYYTGLFDHISPRLVIVSNGRFTGNHSAERYSQVATGCGVHRRSGGIQEMKCLTTEANGIIEIAMGWINEGKKSFLTVTAG